MDEYFSNRLDWDQTPNELTRMLRAKRRLGCDIVDLRNLNPTTAGFDYPHDAIAAAMARGCREPYEPEPLGLPAARQAVADYYAARGMRVDPRDICLTASTSESYTWLFQLLGNPGDALVDIAGYPLIRYLVRLSGLRPEWLVLGDDRQPASLVISPGIPCGNTGRGAYLKERFQDRPYIIDEVFADYPLDLEAVPRFADQREYPAFVLNGLSKVAGLPQMKLGWIVVSGPDAFRAQAMERLELIADTYLSVSGPVQHAAADLLALADPIQDQIRGRCRENLATLRELIGDCPALTLDTIDAGWCALLILHHTLEGEQVALDLLEQADVQVLPGSYFAKLFEYGLVLSLITPPDVFRRGVTAMVTHMDSYDLPPYEVACCEWDDAEPHAVAVRTAVFIQEQGIDPAIEMDGRDPDCLHVVAISAAGEAIGTGRLMPDGRIGRMAVLANWRGQGVGSAMLQDLLESARDDEHERIYLHAQVRAMGVYLRAGFVAVGDAFMEAGIPHMEMEWRPEP